MTHKEKVINDIIKIEGGYTNDPSDSGGETKYGITVETARRNGYKGDMKKLTKKEAFTIYETVYWHSIKADAIGSISQELADKLFDISVNMGSGRAGEFLQRSLNVLNNKEEYYNDVKVDGAIGNITLSRLGVFAKKRFSDVGEEVIIEMVTCLQGAFYVELSERREKDEKYIYGWYKHRIL